MEKPNSASMVFLAKRQSKHLGRRPAFASALRPQRDDIPGTVRMAMQIRNAGADRSGYLATLPNIVCPGHRDGALEPARGGSWRYSDGGPAVERNRGWSDRRRSSQAPMPSVGSRTANASRK